MAVQWDGPDKEGIISTTGLKRLPFEHEGRHLEVRAAFDPSHQDWIVAVKEGDRFVAPREAFTISKEIIFDARQQGGVFSDLLPLSMVFTRDKVLSGAVSLVPKDEASTEIKRQQPDP